MKRAAAFSLIEVTLSLAILGVALLAVLGILPVGLDVSKRAVDSTVVANILDSLHHRLQGEPLTVKAGQSVSFSPAFFDAQGVYLTPARLQQDGVLPVYRADVDLRDWSRQPEHTSSLRVAHIALTWPVQSTGDLPAGRKPQVVVSYPVTALTGPDWPEIAKAYTPDPDFTPKVGF